MNINQMIARDKNMTTLNTSLTASGLHAIFTGTERYTLFAPVNLAFSRLSKGELEKLLKQDNQTELDELLKAHLVHGQKKLSELRNGQKLKSINGTELSVEVKDGDVSINGAKVLARNMHASNGIVHSVDKVIKKS